MNVLMQLNAESGPWLAEQRFARDILNRVIQRRRSLTPEMRELADAVRLPLLRPLSLYRHQDQTDIAEARPDPSQHRAKARQREISQDQARRQPPGPRHHAPAWLADSHLRG
jgi:hypothetical protein